jgi:predicted neuraminidase
MDFFKEKIVSGTVPFNECHASSLLQLKDGGFLTTWFAGTKEGKSDVAIWIARRTKEGWTVPETIVKLGYESHWNPVLFRTRSGEINLYFKSGAKICDWITWVMRSEDEGITWSVPEELVPGDRSGGRGPVKNKPITLADGTIAAPASVERDIWEAFVDLSHDDGHSWTRSEIVPMEDIAIEDKHSGNHFGLIQPSLWESAPGKVHMLLRSNNGLIYRSDSEDNGQTWCKAYATELPNNNSGIDMAKLNDGTLALVYNFSTENWGDRCKLLLAFSRDNGQTWPEKRILDYSPVKETNGLKIEFSYPAIIPLDQGLAITYTLHRKNMVFAAGTVEDFLKNLPSV